MIPTATATMNASGFSGARSASVEKRRKKEEDAEKAFKELESKLKEELRLSEVAKAALQQKLDALTSSYTKEKLLTDRKIQTLENENNRLVRENRELRKNEATLEKQRDHLFIAVESHRPKTDHISEECREFLSPNTFDHRNQEVYREYDKWNRVVQEYQGIK